MLVSTEIKKLEFLLLPDSESNLLMKIFLLSAHCPLCRCGALHVGDQVLSIDNVSTDSGGVSVKEASELLNSASDQIKIEILPISHLALSASKQGRK